MEVPPRGAGAQSPRVGAGSLTSSSLPHVRFSDTALVSQLRWWEVAVLAGLVDTPPLRIPCGFRRCRLWGHGQRAPPPPARPPHTCGCQGLGAVLFLHSQDHSPRYLVHMPFRVCISY